MIFRASSVGNIMGLAKSIGEHLITDEVKSIQSKTRAKRTKDEQQLLDDLLWSTLPSGAITELNKMISQQLINWRDAELDFYTLEKGKQCEDDSIELYNQIHDTFYTKNAVRITTGNLTGECDLICHKQSLVIDIKTAYSKKTYPLMLKISPLYEWQLRAYMYLYDVNQAELAYCLVDTPIDLIDRRDPEHWHNISDVPEHLRVTTLRIERCKVKEKQLLDRIELSMNYINEQLELKK